MKIGILGLAGSGKDTFASILVEELNKEAVRTNEFNTFRIDRYARPLKELTCRIFGTYMNEVEDRVIKEKAVQVDRDKMIDEVFNTLVFKLKFNDEQMQRASELFFEHFSSHRKISPREFQQIFGTEVVRAIDKDAWVNVLKHSNENLIVPDVRFDNEYCDHNVLILRFPCVPQPKHESERLAWALQFQGTCVPPRNCLDIYSNFDGTTLDELREYAKDYVQTLMIKMKLSNSGV